MTTLKLLPYEILQKIFQNFRNDSKESRHWLCNSRFVSRSFNDLIVPILFAKETHVPSRQQLSRCLAISADLKAGVTSVFSSTKHLTVTMDASDEEYREPYVELWKLMLPTMTSIRSLHWNYFSDPDQCPMDTFIRDIGARCTLTDLNLRILAAPPCSRFSLEPLSNLTTVEIHWMIPVPDEHCDRKRWQRQSTRFMSQISALLKRCPDLESFTFSTHYFPTPRTLTPITLASLLDQLQSSSTPRKLRRLVIQGVIVHVGDIRSNLYHLHHLEELVLEADPDPSASTHFGDICATLQRNDIRVKSLFIESLQHSGVSQYISSYQSLEKLVLRKFDHTHDSPVIIGGFITSLQNHCKTLKWLEFDLNRLSPWPQGIVAHLQSEAEQYVALQTLRIRLCITLDDTNTVEGQILTELLETAMRLQALRRLECPSVKYKTGSRVWEDQIELRWSRDDPSRIHAFMKRIVERFKRAHEPKFVIQLSLS
ncbi:hypothetical protein NP233_g645 [Leucocoprinus birnbaumii]|uniref:F-box domain-containing protein n=1 Tax=Leucocoprinus birnbaumii TaxID=56174 RepID=A0AAD5W2F6_9AGAR|nr:hypothetical protein NP233_g645 [Leucocoprinus birnbaumii]